MADRLLKMIDGVVFEMSDAETTQLAIDMQQMADDLAAQEVTSSKLTRRQFMLALYNAGLYNKVLSYVNSMTDQYPPLKIEFDNATEFDRNSPVLQVAAVDPDLDFTDAQIDALFAAGKLL